ncbi:WhiB family transcriptional regulator [Streptomyces collinus]|uniref:WhiB family transcriptional regulator n=1 Tax=Streptomyces collinus TaxID=42684 RepID=UPI00381ED261
MSITSTSTRRPTTPAANWRDYAVCREVDDDLFFVDNPGTQQRVQGVCRGCPVRVACLDDAIRYEAASYMRWGVVGGLTTLQRRALRCEALLGNQPNLKQARELASPRWSARMAPLRYRGLTPEQMVVELRTKHSLIVSAVTVRLAVWWAGGKGGVLPRRGPGDERFLWELVRDEARDVVFELRGLGAGNRDVAAYLQVSEDALGKAIHAWRREATEEVAAA